MCGLKISDHDHENHNEQHPNNYHQLEHQSEKINRQSEIGQLDSWCVSKCSIENGITDAYGEMFFSPSGNSSKV